MVAFLLRRLSTAFVTLVGICAATFFLVHAAPGDPVDVYLGSLRPTSVSPEIAQKIRHEHHLDQPLLIQFAYWLRDAATLDFGESIMEAGSARARIARALPATLLLNSAALFLALLIALPIGFLSAVRPRRFLDHSSRLLFFLLYSLPNFWVALILIRLFAVRLQILPLFGMTSDDYGHLSAAARVGDIALHMVLPVLTLTYSQLALFARFARVSLLEETQKDYMKTARAKGLHERAVMIGHGVRNAAIPMISLLSLTVPYIISGSVVVEKIFSWDGIGLLFINAVLSRDYPVVMALAVVTAFATLVFSILADLFYAWADPRIRLSGLGARG